MEFVKKVLGLPPMGDAINYPVNSQYPILNSVVVFKQGNVGHVAIVTGIIGDSIIYTGSNGSYDERIDVGVTMKITDRRIVGYYIPPPKKLAFR